MVAIVEAFVSVALPQWLDATVAMGLQASPLAPQRKRKREKV